MGVSMSYLKKPITDKYSGEVDVNFFACGYSTMQGWRKNQEDALKIALNVDGHTHIFGVFDGHGGKTVSQFCSRYFVECLKRTNSYARGDLKTALEECFLYFDKILYDFDKLIEVTREYLPSDQGIIDRMMECQRSSQAVCSSFGESSQANQASSASHIDELYTAPFGCESRVIEDGREKKSNFENKQNGVGDETAFYNGENGEVEEANFENGENEDQSNGQTSNGSDHILVASDASSSSNVKGKGKKKKETAPHTSNEEETASPNNVSNELNFVSKVKKIESDESFGDCGVTDEGENEDDEDNEYRYGQASHLYSSDEEEFEDEDYEEGNYDTDEMCEIFGPHGWVVPRARHCGTTAVVAIIRDNKVYCANAGDSRCVLCRDGEAVELSKDHKPDLPEERKRIENAGSIVSRSGRHSRIDESLNLSRAIGDLHFKRNIDLPPDQQVVIAWPDIKVIDIDPFKDEFLVLASDGIWSVWSSQAVVEFVRRRFRYGKSVTSICNELFDATIGEDPQNRFVGDDGFDNMTIIIVRLKRPVNIFINNAQAADKIKVNSEILNKEDKPQSSYASEEDIGLKRNTTNEAAEIDAKRLKAES